MISHIRPALVMTLLLTLLCGLVYPLAITGIAQLGLAGPANGSLAVMGGKVVGSRLIGQAFTRPEYFWPRPSATTPAYNAAGSSGSNLGPTSASLVERVAGAVKALGAKGPVPADAVTTSGSGLDPDISPANANMQVARVATARGLPAARVAALVAAMTDAPFLGIFGEPRVNVLALNMALDQLSPPREPHGANH
jgi:K+-transporting ATPase ATPase C chain